MFGEKRTPVVNYFQLIRKPYSSTVDKQLKQISFCLLFTCKGFVATLKENFGFLETAEHDKEVFFHYRFVYMK